MNYKWILSLLLLPGVLLGEDDTVAAGSPRPQPVFIPAPPIVSEFIAIYDAEYNGDHLGEAVLSLSYDGRTYFMQYRMKAKRGFAALVGSKLHEQGQFKIVDGNFRPQSFSHRSKAFLSKKKWDAQFDWATQQVTGENEGDDYELALQDELIDPLTAFIDSDLRLIQGQSEWTQATLVKGERREYHYRAQPPAPITTACGEFSAKPLQRSRDESPAVQETWHAQAVMPVPVRIRKTQRDGDVLDLQLSHLQLAGQRYCGDAEALADGAEWLED
ncbi:MAG: hypothetical protein Tsb002_07010 [Wenzhouxiangellaceae bacterium]